MEDLVVILRKALVRELETINIYEAFLDGLEDGPVKDLIVHIRDEEKEHVAELTHRIIELDGGQKNYFAKDHTVSEELRLVLNRWEGAEAAPSEPDGPREERGRAEATIGSLKGLGSPQTNLRRFYNRELSR